MRILLTFTPNKNKGTLPQCTKTQEQVNIQSMEESLKTPGLKNPTSSTQTFKKWRIIPSPHVSAKTQICSLILTNNKKILPLILPTQ